jgi:1-acyl-sn-glycerol-3-phosphate acyltransferase
MPNQQLMAISFLSLVGALLVFQVIRELFRAPFSPVQNGLWWGAQVFTRFWWRTRLPTNFPLPETGAVLICNHRSSIDPIFLQVLCRRVMHWLVAVEFCKNPLFSGFLKILKVIPVRRRGIDTDATKTAIGYAQRGGLIGMFPEGRINMTEALMLPGRPGAVMIAIKAKVPIIPCYVEGSPYDGTPWSPLFMPARVKLQVGEPIRLDEYHGRHVDGRELKTIMQRCMQAIAGLAGQADFEPRIAGRRWKPTEEELQADLAEAKRIRRKYSPPGQDAAR